MAERTKENRYKLARVVVDSWDLETLLYFAIETLRRQYEKCQEHFDEDWETQFGEEED